MCANEITRIVASVGVACTGTNVRMRANDHLKTGVTHAYLDGVIHSIIQIGDSFRDVIENLRYAPESKSDH